MSLSAEFTIEPFKDGDPGRHVTEALDAAKDHDVVLEVGPFGTNVSGDQAQLLPAIHDMLAAAMSAGASRVSLQITRSD